MKKIAFCSFGADSTANVLLGMQHNEYPDEIVYCEVMFDQETSGEIPEHRDFVYEKAIPFFEKEGIKVNVVKGEKTYKDCFFQKVGERGKEENRGKYWGFPLCGKCHIQRDCKVRPMEKYEKARWANEEIIKLSGIALDEEARLVRMLGYGGISNLEKYKVNQQEAREISRKAGLKSPCYEFANRNGCFFCPNSKMPERRHLYDYHKNLWDEMLALQRVKNKTTELFDRSFTIFDLDRNFRLDDSQMNLFSSDPVPAFEFEVFENG